MDWVQDMTIEECIVYKCFILDKQVHKCRNLVPILKQQTLPGHCDGIRFPKKKTPLHT